MKLKIFVTLLILLASQLMAGEKEIIPTELPYDVGDTLPDTIFLDMDTIFAWLPSIYSSVFDRYFHVTIGGVKYYYNLAGYSLGDISSDSLREILAIWVTDTGFVTPEGLRIGQPFTDVLPYSKGEIIRVYTSHKVFARLPSGWEASYRLGSRKESDTALIRKKDTIPITERKIDFFCKPGSSYWYFNEDKCKIKIEGYDINPDDS